jgi:hypothetical protein
MHQTFAVPGTKASTSGAFLFCLSPTGLTRELTGAALAARWWEMR